jgi:site-specific recombinase XerD
MYNIIYSAKLYLLKCTTAAGIKKTVSFHVARHTFATTFLRIGGTVEVLQKLLGHSKLETTMEYIHIMEETLIDQMENFNKIKPCNFLQ